MKEIEKCSYSFKNAAFFRKILKTREDTRGEAYGLKMVCPAPSMTHGFFSVNLERKGENIVGLVVWQSTFFSSNQENQITYYVYREENLKPKGIVQISHGMCEYFLRYDHFARYLAKHGYIVCGNDHLGHGNSVEKQSDLGFFASDKGFYYLVEDLHILTQIIKQKYPGLPVVLLGHSMGSFVARIYLDRYGSELSGAILSGTSGGNSMTGVGIRLAKSLKRVYGERYRSEMLKRMVNYGYNSRYQEHYSDSDWLSRDRSVIEAYDHDSRCNFTFTVSAYLDLFALLEHVSRKGWGFCIPKDLPIYLFSGTDDPVGDFGKGVEKVYKHLLHLEMKDVSMRLYEKGRHEMLNEVNREEVYQNILRWLDEKLLRKTDSSSDED